MMGNHLVNGSPVRQATQITVINEHVHLQLP
jgi:hypothetical protein